MAQPSISCYFSERKRSAVEDLKINRVKKALLLDKQESGSDFLFKNEKFTFRSVDCDVKDVPPFTKSSEHQEKKEIVGLNKNLKKLVNEKPRKMVASRRKVSGNASDIGDIKNLLNNMKTKASKVTEINIPSENINHVTPPSTPTKNINALDKVKEKPDGPSLKELKRKMTRSVRLAELKASIGRFQDNADKLKEIEKKTDIPESPKLKSFRTIELEINTSPQKVFSPEKQYLSPKKDLGARRNLFNLPSPTKNAVSLPTESPAKLILEETSKPALKLPYKYRYLAEIFRSTDIVCQILYNRKETITFKKLKPAVEKMLKRNLLEKHLSQIKSIYPDAFSFCQEKIRMFGAGIKQEGWQLVVVPKIGEVELMNSETLLQRRRKLFGILLDKVKIYHEEFLSSLDPPITLDKEKLTRWHPEFDIEKVPDIECSQLPQPPVEEKFSTGKDVLEKARQMYNCNSRMEQALQKLKDMKSVEISTTEQKEPPPAFALKGIPKALLEKVRQKQAAKALIAMTRSEDKEKELKVYSRLPELARLTRNLFVSEKKSVLPLEIVLEKLNNCYRSNLTKAEMEQHLRTISKEFPTWLVFHGVRNCDYVKISKSDDLSLIIEKLEHMIKQKSRI